MSVLSDSLNLILEDNPAPDGDHPLHTAMDVARQLQDAHQNVADLQHRLTSIKSRMAGELAMAIRRAQPSLNVAVDKGGCKVGYKTKTLLFTPEIEQGMWRVVSPNQRFRREFLKAHSRTMLLVPDLSGVAEAIVGYFREYYRTLGEELLGAGVILVEDKRVTFLELGHWQLAQNALCAQPPKRPLRSRSGRLSC